MSKLLIALLLFCPLVYGSVDSQGWHWYPPVLPKTQKPLSWVVPLKQLTPQLQLKVIQWYINTAKDEAVLHPSVANNKRYLQWQQFATDKAGQFTKTMQDTLLLNPQLDYNLKYSHYNNAAHITLVQQQAKENEAIDSFARTDGLFFFYRGKNPVDAGMAPMVVQFSRQHHMALIGVSEDGTLLSGVSDSRSDQGQSRRMGVKAFPALFLVNPSKHTYQPVAYGFISGDVLAAQFLNVATHFKAEF